MELKIKTQFSIDFSHTCMPVLAVQNISDNHNLRLQIFHLFSSLVH